MRRLLLFVSIVSMSLAPISAHAKPKTVREELPDTMRRSWDTASELYGIQDYEGALAEYQRVYEATKNARVLYNVAICNKDLKRYKAASDVLRRALQSRADLPKDDVAAMETALRVIEPFITKVELITNEPGASLFIDDIEIGKTPFTEPVSVDAGSHVVKLTKPGFAPVVTKVSFTTSGANRLDLKLEPTVRMAHVTIEASGAPSAMIWIDDRERGPAPFDGDLEEGPHDLEARAQDYVPTRQHVTIVYKQPASFTLALGKQRHEGVLRVVATPESASIVVDDKVVGRGVWEGPLETKGGHQLVVKKDGYYTYSSEIVLGDDQKRVVPVTLNPEKTWIYWAIGASVVVAGGIVAGYFALRAPDRPVERGTLDAGSMGFGTTSFQF